MNSDVKSDSSIVNDFIKSMRECRIQNIEINKHENMKFYIMFMLEKDSEWKEENGYIPSIKDEEHSFYDFDYRNMKFHKIKWNYKFLGEYESYTKNYLTIKFIQ